MATIAADRTKLRQLETVLTTARKWAIEEAKALRIIRDQRLYRATHKTFDAYTSQRWGLDRTYAYRCCAWAEVIAAVLPIGNSHVPQREAHARPLYGLKPDQQRTIWRDVVRRLGGSRTATAIEVIAVDHLRVKAPQRAPQTAHVGRGDVVHGDAFIELRKLTKASAGLCLFSPPYCEQRRGSFPSVAENEFPAWMARLMTELKPVMRDDGNVLVVGREHVKGGEITDAWLHARLAIRASGWHEIDTLVWSKPDAPPLGRMIDRPRRVYEFVYWFCKTSSPYINLRSEAETGSGKIRHQRNGTQSGWGERAAKVVWREQKAPRVTDMVTAMIGGSPVTGHPAPFPPSLASQLIRAYSRPNDLVLDPCAGSGTTLVAARDAGRSWWGCDVVREYVEQARRRLAE